MRYFILVVALAISLASCAQDSGAGKIVPVVETLTFPLGDTVVVFTKRTYAGAKGYLLLQLHDNEATAEEAAMQYLQRRGGTLLSIENKEQRNIAFSLDGQVFTFDPNRMFTPTGLKATLDTLSQSTPEAIRAVEGLAQALLQQLPDTVLVVAVHNNTDAAFSVSSYLQDTVYQKDAAAVHTHPSHDADHFFLTTDSTLYQKLAHLKYNVIWQHNSRAADDGSLSVYLGKKGVRYVNVEAQHGHTGMQLQMLEALLQEHP